MAGQGPQSVYRFGVSQPPVLGPKNRRNLGEGDRIN